MTTFIVRLVEVFNGGFLAVVEDLDSPLIVTFPEGVEAAVGERWKIVVTDGGGLVSYEKLPPKEQ
jgi:hypothetical protein